MYRQDLAPVAGSLLLSALLAAIPLAALFVMLGVLRMRAWIAALVSLVLAGLIAVVAWGMPVRLTADAAALGAAFGFFPILWIVINAIWLYNMTVSTGHFDVLRRSFSRISDDQRMQAVIVAFCFGALMEALAGFGTPVAITAVMLIALGFKPMKAAAVALVANTAPVAFGALATPIVTLGQVTNLSVDTLGAMVGRQTPLLSVIVPLVLVFMVDGRRGLRQTWLPALACGLVFGVAQWLTSNFVSVPLADIAASLLSALAMVVILRLVPLEPVTAEPAESTVDEADSRADVFRAYAPYLIIVVVFCVAQLPPVLKLLNAVTASFPWPGLEIQNSAGKVLTLTVFKLNWLSAAGTLMLISGLISIPVLAIKAGEAVRSYGRTLRQLATAIVTVMAVLGLAYVMNASGQTTTLGTQMASAGAAFAVLSPILGWLGVAVTGSDTSSNSLFGALQVAAANKAGLQPALMAAANSSGGVLGKMISPQNLAIAAAAVGLAGQEGNLFRKVFGWSLLLLAVMCLIVVLQSTPVLGWMVP
ncbi:L-lactate permease [Fodinicola acaciae]|uniref:L-lactate permease n=1 Tax=Fodinicola acaciae TaxID=2681555 RepID=UPI0013D60056|nr:L-lactate permease [Fodinicola acaciae]